MTLLPFNASTGSRVSSQAGPLDAAVAPNGDTYFVTSGTVWLLAAGETEAEVFDAGPFSFLYGVAVDSTGTVYVSDFIGGQVYRYDSETQTRTLLDAPGSPGLISVDRQDNLLVPNLQGNALYRYDTEGTRTTLLDTGLSQPVDAVEDSDGSIVISNYGSGDLVRLDDPEGSEPTATVITTLTLGLAGIALADDGTIYATNYRTSDDVTKISEDGGAVEVIATGLDDPWGLARADFAFPSTEQTITFTSEAPEDVTVGDTYTPTATGGASGNPVTFSIAGSSADVCSIDAETNEVTFDAPGTCTIAADQAGGTVDDVTYADAEQVTQDVTVNVPELFITGQITSDSPANEAGWYRTPATITYTCGGGTAPLDCPEAVTRDNTQPGFKVARKVTDANGNTAKDRTLLQVDTTAPSLKFSGIGSGPYDRKARPVSCTAVDRNSGIDSDCVVTYGRVVSGPDGGATRRWTATATDVAGNTTTVSRAFRVKGKAPARPAVPGMLG